MNNFALFTSISFLYFAAASFAEAARRLGKHHLASSFLLCDDSVFAPALIRLCRRPTQSGILQAIEPFNVAGLGAPDRRNWFPVDKGDLLRAAGKLGASEDEILLLLERSGFT